MAARTIAIRGGIDPRRLLLREVALPAAFVAAILASNYALASIPNVKFFDLLVFVAGYALGVRRGATVAVAAWFVYGQANPFGYAPAPLLATLMTAEIGYAVAGAIVRRLLPPERARLAPWLACAAFAVAALSATVAYDVATNIYTGIFWAGLAGPDASVSAWVWTALTNPGALFFMAAHVGSNLVFFTLFGPPLTRGACALDRNAP